MLKKSYILNFIIDAKYKNICYFCLGPLGGVVFDSAWGVIPSPSPPPERNTA
jgi:hypothetical protein